MPVENVRLLAKSDGLWLCLTAEGNSAMINLSLTVHTDGLAAAIVDSIRRDLLATHLVLEPKSAGERP